MAIRYKHDITSPGFSEWVRIDSIGSSGGIYLIAVDMDDAVGLADVEFAVEEDISEDMLVLRHNVLKGLTTSLASKLEAPMTYIRVNTLSLSRGTIKLRVVQV